MDVKCAFLNGELEEIIYFENRLVFVSEIYPDHCYVFDQGVYGLKQAPHALYETRTRFFKKSKYKQRSVDERMFKLCFKQLLEKLE